jgi:Spy/CpxP family protein refolding chaperone
MIRASRNKLLFSLFILSFLSCAGLALAQEAAAPPPPAAPPAAPSGPGLDAPPPPPSLTPEQLVLSHKLWGDHFDKTRPLREDIRDQNLIYDALVANPNATRADIESVVAKMRSARDQLDALRKQFLADYAASGLPPLGHREYMGGCFSGDGYHGMGYGHKGWNGPRDGGRGYGHGGYGRGDHDGYGRGGYGHKGASKGHRGN